eukprot:462660_1
MAEITASSISYLLFTILIGLSIPLCLYSVAKFYSFKNDVRFRKRHGKLSMFTALCFISELFSGCLLTLAFSGFASRNTSITLAWFGDILNIVSYFLIIHCLVLRFWMLYFDIRYQIAIRDNVWKSIIDEHYVANEENLSSVKFNIEDDSDDLWFIKNKITNGNTKWMFKVWFSRSFMSILCILILMIVIEIIFNVGILSSRRGLIETVFTILFFIPFLFMIYIYHKIPPFHDTYFIRKEIVVIHNIDLIDVVASATVSIIANYGIYSANNGNVTISNPYLNAVVLVTFYIMGISHIIIVYIMTFWVKNKIIQDKKQITVLYNTNSQCPNDFPMDLRQILEHQFGYELFMEHLVKEHANENLLSLTEFMQFKYLLIEDNKIDDTLMINEVEINLPSDYIPKSSIVYGESSYENKIYKLYNKYVRVGSEYEINVSYRMRDAFKNKMNELYMSAEKIPDYEEYFNIFDDFIVEILRLLSMDPYLRFSRTDKYKQLKKVKDMQTTIQPSSIELNEAPESPDPLIE